jgi:hypothetical protein
MKLGNRGIKKGIISREAASFPVIGIYHALPIIQLFYKKATDLRAEKSTPVEGFLVRMEPVTSRTVCRYRLRYEAVPGKRKTVVIKVKGFVFEEQKRNNSFLTEEQVIYVEER